jgi:hypothetical protein
MKLTIKELNILAQINPDMKIKDLIKAVEKENKNK